MLLNLPIRLADVVDDATARQWWREQWRHPEFVSRQVEELQWEALAVLLANPAWTDGLQSSLFASDEHPEYFAVFRHIAREKACGDLLLGRLCSIQVSDEELLCIWYMLDWPWGNYANSRWRLDNCMSRLQTIFAWQFRQEKALRQAV